MLLANRARITVLVVTLIDGQADPLIRSLAVTGAGRIRRGEEARRRGEAVAGGGGGGGRAPHPQAHTESRTPRAGESAACEQHTLHRP